MDDNIISMIRELDKRITENALDINRVTHSLETLPEILKQIEKINSNVSNICEFTHSVDKDVTASRERLHALSTHVNDMVTVSKNTTSTGSKNTVLNVIITIILAIIAGILGVPL